MKIEVLPIKEIHGQPLNAEQTNYLSGFFAGIQSRGISFGDVEATPAVGQLHHEDLIAEERIKREQHPLDAYPALLEYAAANKAPDKEDLFRFKWNGLFFLTPNKEAYMARLRIPGGMLQTFQLREIARVAQELTTGYVQITTRANLQIRLIEPKNTPEVLRRIQSVGLHTRGAGADNIRNITINPTAGFDPHELIDVRPYCHELAQIIISSREFYDLPRKFNIALDGGGLVGAVEDTNDIGASAVRRADGVYFRIKLGGATGHKAFAKDSGVLVKPEELVKTIVALVRVYIANGNRTDRKRARLKHLLETWSLDQYILETEKLLDFTLQREVAADGAASDEPRPDIQHTHVGVYPQNQPGLHYIGVAIPVGNITPKQMLRIAELADLYGNGEVRLTVWQNLLIPNVSEAFVGTVKKALKSMGFGWEASNVRSGIIACTGSSYCKFAQSHTKEHALILGSYLEKKLRLDQPVNIHFTGCPHSCAQHYMGDIGLLGTRTRVAGESMDGYHIFVGGGFGERQAVGRQIFTGVAADSLPGVIEQMLKGYLRRREGNESFQAFTMRHEVGDLQGIFSNDE